MSSLYLGIRLLEKPYERLKLNDINLSTKNIFDLKIDAEKLLNFSHDELEFIYCGNVLKNDNQSLAEYGVRAGATIHVFQKQLQTEHVSEPVTDEQIQKAVISYDLVFNKPSGSSLSIAKAIRPEVLRKVLEAYPEFYSNLGAYAILRDAILISPMSLIESAKEIAKQYPILIHSAEFVTKTMKEYSNKPNLSTNPLPSEDSLSDSSSSDGDSPMASPNTQMRGNRTAGDIRQISRDQLAAALHMAGSSSRNSLSNIAQRNAVVPSTSSSSGGSGGIISSSLFTNALSQALRSGRSSSGASSQLPSSAANNSGTNDNLARRYANELQTMREMGLFEEMINIQALVVSNGDVEAAINLVLSGNFM